VVAIAPARNFSLRGSPNFWHSTVAVVPGIFTSAAAEIPGTPAVAVVPGMFVYLHGNRNFWQGQ
jgi:hypothetical protein